MSEAKMHFLKEEFIPLLKTIPADKAPLWGKMAVQQMVEHFSDAVRIASGKMADIPIVTTAEDLPKMQAFLASDKPFRENTRNPLLPENPVPVRHASMLGALHELQAELDLFFQTFSNVHAPATHNPIFGELNFEMNIKLLYKHAVHHLRQFGVEVRTTA